MAAPVDTKLLKQTKFPPEFSRKVDMTKVNIEVMKKWIAGRISEILGNEDDVVIELCFNLLEGSRFPDIKSLQIQLTGFLDKDTSKFCKELWSLCLSGQENPQGVPKELLEAKKLELIQEKIEAEKAAEAARRQKEQERVRERDLEDLRRRERADRGRARRGPGRGSRDFDRRRSRSPRDRSRDRYREPPSRREFDSYVPSSSHRGRRSTRTPSRSRSRSRSRSHSISRSPPRRNHRKDRDGSQDRRRRRPTFSRSLSPDRRDRRGSRRSPDHGDRHRSNTRSDSSRSRTPRRDRKGRRSVSRSVTPPRHHNRHKRRSSGSRYFSRSRSRSRERRGRYHKRHDSRRLSRSRDRGYHRRHGSRSRSRSRSRDRGHHHRYRRSSKSRSRSSRRDRGRRQSVERYNPAIRRRHGSSASASGEKRPKLTDEFEDSARPSQSETMQASGSDDKEMNEADEATRRSAPVHISSTDLREKLLREKLVAMRRSSSEKVGVTSTDKV